MLIEIDAYLMALRRLGEALNRMHERGYVEDPRFRAALWLISDDLQACCPAALEARKAVVELNGVVMSMSETLFGWATTKNLRSTIYRRRGARWSIF